MDPEMYRIFHEDPEKLKEIEEGLVYGTEEWRKFNLTIPFLRQLKSRCVPSELEKMFTDERRFR